MNDGKGGQPGAGSAVKGFPQPPVLLGLPQHRPGNNPRSGPASSPAWEEKKGADPCKRNQTRKENKKPWAALETPLWKGEVSFSSTRSLLGESLV